MSPKEEAAWPSVPVPASPVGMPFSSRTCSAMGKAAGCSLASRAEPSCFPRGRSCCSCCKVTLLLLALAQVVAGSTVAGRELQAGVLLLIQNLYSKIHRAVGAMWAAEIPLLLQCLEGKVLVGERGGGREGGE